MGFLGNFLGSKAVNAPASEKFLPLLELITDVLGPEVTRARDYEKKIIPALAVAVAHFDREVARIPGPVELAAPAYGKDPFLRTVFPEALEIQVALGRSVEIRDLLPSLAKAGHRRACALVGMRCKDRDLTPGQATVFADHTLACVAVDAVATRAALCEAACRRIVKNFNEHLDKLRQKGKLLPEEWDIEDRPPAADGNAAARHLLFDDFIYAEQALQPDHLLRGLVAWLERPAARFSVVDSGLVVAGPGNGAPACGVPLLNSADRRRWLVFLAEFSVGEAIRALGLESHNHRYIFI